MLDFDRTVAVSCLADETYFSGANSGAGFVDLYGDIFSEREIDSLYIIKGGPGTGKSTLMKRVLKEAKENGAYACAYLCGSDPESLDAVTLSYGNKRVVLVDGTSPHAYDAGYPGAVSVILDTGAFFDRAVLLKARDEIISLAESKRMGYSRAYRYLSALKTFRTDLRSFTDKATDWEKAEGAAKRLAAKYLSKCSADTAVVKRRVYTADSMRGRCILDIAPIEKTVCVSDADWTFPVFMACLSEILSSCGVDHTTYSDNVDLETLRGIYIPSSDIYVLPFAEKKAGAVKNVNMWRFVSSEKLRASRNKRSFIKKCARSMEDGARSALADSAKHHFALEEIYKNAMDFDLLNEASEKWTREILSRLN